METTVFKLNKNERLCRQSLIEDLFANGLGFSSFPLRITYLFVTNCDENFQVMFVVSKKRYKRANKRNLLKRRMREAFRLHKHELYNDLINSNIALNIAIHYIGNDILEFTEIEKKMIKAIQNLKSIIQTKINA